MKLEIFRNEFKLAKLYEDAGFVRTASTGQLLVIKSTVKLEGFGATSSCREDTRPRDDAQRCPERAFGNDTKVGPALGLVVTKQYDRYGVEIRWNKILGGHRQGN